MRTILTVITPAPSYDLTVLATLKNELGITDTASDIALSALIVQASGVVTEITGRVWAQEEVSEKFYLDWGENVPSLLLERRPVSAIASITENGSVLVEDVDYVVDYRRGMVHRINGSVWTFSNNPSVVIQYTGGYALLDDLPFGPERATLILAKSYWYARARDPATRSETTNDIDSVTYRDAGDAETTVRELLRLHSEVVMA